MRWRPLVDGLSRISLVTVSLALSGLTTLLVNVGAARHLDRPGYAAFATGFALALALAQAPASLLTPLVLRVAARAEERERRAVAGRLVVVALVPGAAVASLLAATAVAVLPSVTLADLLALAVLAAAYAQYVVSKYALLAAGRTRPFLAREAALDATLLAALGAAAASGAGAHALLQVVAAVYAAYALAWTALDRAPASGAARLGRADLAFGGWSFLATYASVAFLPLMVAAAGTLEEPADVARLAAAVALATPLLLIPQAAGALTFVDFSRRAGRSETTWLALHVYLSAALAGAACIAVALLGDAPGRLLFGVGYGDLREPLAIVTAAVALRCVAPPLGAALSARDRFRATAAIVIVATATGLAALPVLAAAGVAEPAAWATLAGTATLAVPTVLLARTAFDLPARFAVAVLACPVAAAAAAAGLGVAAAVGLLLAWALLLVRCGGAIRDLARTRPAPVAV